MFVGEYHTKKNTEQLHKNLIFQTDILTLFLKKTVRNFKWIDVKK